MATFVLIHGAGDSGWYWHLLEAELRRRGHDVVAPDLPSEDDSAGLPAYADTVVDAIGDRADHGGAASELSGCRQPPAPASDQPIAAKAAPGISCTRWSCRTTRRRSTSRPGASGPRRSSSRGRRPRPCPG
jgi:Alpha/beta hydrolase family